MCPNREKERNIKKKQARKKYQKREIRNGSSSRDERKKRSGRENYLRSLDLGPETQKNISSQTCRGERKRERTRKQKETKTRRRKEGRKSGQANERTDRRANGRQARKKRRESERYHKRRKGNAKEREVERCGWIVPEGRPRGRRVPWRAAGRVHGVFRVVLRCTVVRGHGHRVYTVYRCIGRGP